MTEWCTERDRMMSKINECQFNFVYLYSVHFVDFTSQYSAHTVDMTIQYSVHVVDMATQYSVYDVDINTQHMFWNHKKKFINVGDMGKQLF